MRAAALTKSGRTYSGMNRTKRHTHAHTHIYIHIYISNTQNKSITLANSARCALGKNGSSHHSTAGCGAVASAGGKGSACSDTMGAAGAALVVAALFFFVCGFGVWVGWSVDRWRWGKTARRRAHVLTYIDPSLSLYIYVYIYLKISPFLAARRCRGGGRRVLRHLQNAAAGVGTRVAPRGEAALFILVDYFWWEGMGLG